jgi:hypothetical protein
LSFNIQIPTDIVRNNKITAQEFVLLGKLIQAYHLSGRKEEYEVSHKNLMFLLNIGDNNTFKKSYNNLVKHGYILDQLDKLPRKNGIMIRVNPKIIPKKTGKDPFVQLTSDLLNKSVIDEIGYVGIRLIYYYESYINRKVLYKDRCFASEETIAAHLGITKRTVITYNKKIKKCKFVKIEAHDLKETGEYEKKGEKDVQFFNKYNNHYYVNREKISEFVSNENGLI